MKIKPFHGNEKIVKLMDAGVPRFYRVINKYCNQNGSCNTILGWGTESTFLSIFSQGLIKNNRYCLLEMPSPRKVKNTETDEVETKEGRIDAVLIERSRNNTLTAIIEAKRVKSYLTKEVTDDNIDAALNRILNAIEETKTQLWGIDPKDTYLDEKLGDESHINRIALIFTVLGVKFAKSGEGKSLYNNGYTIKEIRNRAKDYFDELSDAVNETVDKKKGDNMLIYDAFIHSNTQLDLIREYYGTKMLTDEGNVVNRNDQNTYYQVGVMVTVANFQ